MPKPAAARTARAASAPPTSPNLCFFATATTAELLLCTGCAVPLPGTGVTPLDDEWVCCPLAEVELATAAALAPPGAAVRLDSVSRLRRFRSATIFAAGR